jgi:hypothetical protein
MSWGKVWRCLVAGCGLNLRVPLVVVGRKHERGKKATLGDGNGNSNLEGSNDSKVGYAVYEKAAGSEKMGKTPAIPRKTRS